MSTEQEAWPPANPAPTHKLPDNYVGLKEAFTAWWNQGSDSPPTNGDIVKYDKIDVDLFATFGGLHLAQCNNAQKHD